MSYILTQALSKGKRVRLIDGRLTPVFEYPRQALNYAKARGINNCLVTKIDIELDFKKK